MERLTRFARELWQALTREEPTSAQRIAERLAATNPWDLPVPVGQTERLAPMVLRADRCGCLHLHGGWLVPCPRHDPRWNGTEFASITSQMENK